MLQLSSQIAVVVVQLTITTLQLFLMLFTWLNPNRGRPFSNQGLEAAQTVVDTQQNLDTSFAELDVALPQLPPSAQ